MRFFGEKKGGGDPLGRDGRRASAFRLEPERARQDPTFPTYDRMRLRRTPFEGETTGTDLADGTPGRKEKKEAEVKRLDPAPLLRALPQGGDPPSGLSHAFSSFTYDVFIIYIVLSFCQARWGLWRLQRKLYVA